MESFRCGDEHSIKDGEKWREVSKSKLMNL